MQLLIRLAYFYKTDENIATTRWKGTKDFNDFSIFKRAATTTYIDHTHMELIFLLLMPCGSFIN